MREIVNTQTRVSPICSFMYVSIKIDFVYHIQNHCTMLYIATTRFNAETWSQNVRCRDNYGMQGCLYGSPTLIKEDIPIGATVAMIEMRNDKNEIGGIGFLRNNIVKNKKYNIYEWGNYNRFIYKSKYRIDRSQFTEEELKVIHILDVLLFKGSRHLKRGQGVTSLPKWIRDNPHICFEKKITEMFRRYFKYSPTRALRPLHAITCSHVDTNTE